tara:strand:- start:6175 stop:6765 length:591 start_codon:yes stop_codon:yes gene_type:complete
MIVITNPIPIVNEINIIHSLFESGLELLHVRKPDYSEEEMTAFLSKIELRYRSKLVLHQQHQLSNNFGINRIHFTENKRTQLSITSGQFAALTRSTATHSIEDFNSLNTRFEYAFLSPVYPSISKPDYASNVNHLETIKHRLNFKTRLVALGGISSKNIKETYRVGFDEVALLGTIWNSTNPIENFKLCQQIAHSF